MVSAPRNALPVDAPYAGTIQPAVRRVHEAAQTRVAALKEQLAVAEGFSDTLAGRLDALR